MIHAYNPNLSLSRYSLLLYCLYSIVSQCVAPRDHFIFIGETYNAYENSNLLHLTLNTKMILNLFIMNHIFRVILFYFISFLFFLTALTRQKSKAFRLWVNTTIDSRDRSQIKEHSRLLSSSAASHTRSNSFEIFGTIEEKLFFN